MKETVEDFYQRIRKGHWPHTYAEAQAHELFSRIVAIRWRLENKPPPTKPVQTTWAIPAPPVIYPRKWDFDPKRAAANDRDD